ncbi:uncharacterized protein ELE39_001806 [Cryptosporidium sp. chipmunk genotype I]|uniref:uncharacterized protein n=1 Tax=Cryptosporidium sp. chipmunk genotype I TaxID=1280935 RepID=UPI003519E9A5|nr:hypothetical protein ELE39_001806 [Cryptosporidium sp. chipmunk genotype I]
MQIKTHLSILFFFLILLCGHSVSLGSIQNKFERKFRAFNNEHDLLESQPNPSPKIQRTSEEASNSLEYLFDESDSTDNYLKHKKIYATKNQNERTNRGAKLRNQVEELLGNMEYAKQKRSYLKTEIPDKYFSFRGAEEHSIDDLDFEGLFDPDYGGRGRVVEYHKITTDDIYRDELRPRKYEYAVGATLRDKKYDKHRKESNNEIVLVITPKNFFADKNGKLSLLPSLALKINKNSKLSTLLKMIHKLISSAYPNIKIERIRHLETQIILNEAPKTAKLSSLKIKNGNEISVTYKNIPKDEVSDNKYYQAQELPVEELPMTPVGKDVPELPELVFKGNLDANQDSSAKLSLENKVLKSEKDDLNEEDIIIEPIESNENVLSKSYDFNVGDLSDELKSEYLEDIQFNDIPIENPDYEPPRPTNFQEYQLLVSDQGMNNIYQERAVESEKANINDFDNSYLRPDLNYCSYKVNFKQITLPVSNFTSEIGQNYVKNISTHNVTFNEFEPCKLENLISKVNEIIRSMNQSYSLVRMEHNLTKRELLSLSKENKKHHLLDLEIIRGDEFNAFLILEPTKESDYANNDIDKKEIIILSDLTESQLSIEKCQIHMTIFVDSTPFREGVDKSLSKKLSNGNQSLGKGGKRHLRAVNICTQSYVPISKVLEKIKSTMEIDSSLNGIFICGDKIIDSRSNLPVSLIKSETCVLRFDS